jgi:hypothetical protein
MRDRKMAFGIIKAMLTRSEEPHTAWHGVYDKAGSTFFCPPFFCLLNVLCDVSAMLIETIGRSGLKIGDQTMKIISFLVVAILILSFTAGLAQPRVSVGITGGVQVYPNHGSLLPLIGASTWLKANQSFLLSGEYLRYRGVDLYPAAPSGFVASPRHKHSRTQRFAIGLHYPVKIQRDAPMTLLGINLGRSWDQPNYNLFTLPVEPPYSHVNRMDHVHRSVLFASLTALSQNQRFPFSLQARFGFSFSDLSSFSLVESKAFWQVLASIHWGVL